jgi:hypothetical protein
MNGFYKINLKFIAGCLATTKLILLKNINKATVNIFDKL